LTTLYGISNCDSVKKACRWLEQQDIDYRFHDFRKDGLDTQQLQRWIEQLGMDRLLNKRSTSWKALADEYKALLLNPDHRTEAGLAIFIRQPTLIKRPLLEQDQRATAVGFSDDSYRQLFGKKD